MGKRLLFIIFLCFAMLLAFAGCGGRSAISDGSGTVNKDQGKTTSGSGGDKESSEGGISVSAPGQYPIADQKVTLTVLIGGNAAVEDFNTNEFSKWYEEKTNVYYALV